ncbi:MAG: hypothetical protein H6961_03750 [Chromatiaceae bacterium]|nr:hypothetical protein [Chromatiaceae bacterium]HPE78733.1 hypothetical protein [Gammaproteobacteria bacterium]
MKKPSPEHEGQLSLNFSESPSIIQKADSVQLTSAVVLPWKLETPSKRNENDKILRMFADYASKLGS